MIMYLISIPGFQIFSSKNDLFLASKSEELGFRKTSAEVVYTAFTAIPILLAVYCANEPIDDIMKMIMNKNNLDFISEVKFCN